MKVRPEATETRWPTHCHTQPRLPDTLQVETPKEYRHLEVSTLVTSQNLPPGPQFVT